MKNLLISAVPVYATKIECPSPNGLVRGPAGEAQHPLKGRDRIEIRGHVETDEDMACTAYF